jgi:hypothetical protein
MNKYAIISDSYFERLSDGGYKDFYILMQNLTKEQILALKESIPEFEEKSKNTHPVNFSLKIKGFEYDMRGDDFQEILLSGKIIPMSNLRDFE